VEETLKKLTEEEFYTWLSEHPHVTLNFVSYHKGTAKYVRYRRTPIAGGANPIMTAYRIVEDSGDAFSMHIDAIEELSDSFTIVEHHDQGWIYEADTLY